jgi:hypothetical protein
MNRPLGRVALVGFFLSLLVHTLTLAHIDVASQFPYVWSLHVGMFLVWIPFVLFERKTFRTQRIKLGEIMSGLPTWASVLVAVVFAYSILNFFLCAHLSGGGNSDIVDGQYVLSSHAHILAHLTENEYHLHRSYEVRMFSGLWLTFYLIPGVYFLFWQGPASLFKEQETHSDVLPVTPPAAE